MPEPAAGHTDAAFHARLRAFVSDPAGALLALSCVAIVFSVAVSQIFLVAGLAVLVTQRKWRAPRATVLLGAYAAWSIVALLSSAVPVLGLSQVRKFFLFLILPAAATAFCTPRQADRVTRALFLAGAAAAVVSLIEFAAFYRALSSTVDFYTAYSQRRITGFHGHWMTFSGQQMMLFAVLAAFLLYSRKRPWWTWLCMLLIGASLVAALTRNAWLGCFAAAAYLLARRAPRWLLVLPVLLALTFLASPHLVRERLLSFTNLRSDSSNQARVVMLRTGLRMIERHPVVGVGPNGVAYYFGEYRPPGPLPVAWYGHLHNNYLEIAAERGLPGLALFLAFLGVALTDLWLSEKRVAPGQAYLVHGVAAAVVAFGVAGAFEYSFSDSEVVSLFLFLVAIGYAAVRGEGDSHAPPAAGGARASASAPLP